MITVFSKQWFKKYSKVITFLARLPFIGELVFNFKKFGHYIDRTKIYEVTPNSVIEDLGYVLTNKGLEKQLRQHFFVRNEYALRLQSVFYPIWITFHIWDIITKPIPQLNLGFDTLTVYPDAGTGSTTVSGQVIRNAAGSTWSDLVTGAGTSASIPATVGHFVIIVSNATSPLWNILYRSIYTFDTSSLTSSATISATVMSLYGVDKADAGSITPNIDIYTATPASDNNLVAGDYSQIGTTSQTGSPIAYADFNTSGYNDFTFNATGRGNVSKTGISKFGARNANYDVPNSEPTHPGSQTSNYLYGNYSSNSTNKPKLVVTYTLPAQAGFLLLMV